MRRTGRTELSRAAALALACAALAAGCGERGDVKPSGAKGALYHYRLAAEKYREGDFDVAIGIYEKSLQMNPRLAEAHLDLGIIYDDYKGAKDKAIEQYREFLSLEPRSPKAEMVRRWILRAGEEKGAPAAPGAIEEPSTAGGEPAPSRAEADRAREDLAILRAENEAYLKTVEALRNELTQAKQEIAAAQPGAPRAVETPAAPGAAAVPEAGPFGASVSGWEAEKAHLWDRYRSEKGQFEKTVAMLREEIAHLQAQKAASDDALKKTHAGSEGVAPAAAGDAAAARELEAARERLRNVEKRSSAAGKDRDSLLLKLKDAERRLQAYRMQQASSDSPLLLAKVKADAERDRAELRKTYEKRISETVAGAARERVELQRELAEAQRAGGRASSAVPTPEPILGSARTRADAEREKAEMKQFYERRLAEASGAAVREKADMQRELSETRREAAYLKGQIEKARATAGQSEQYSAGAIERLREQFRREKSELEQQYRKDREQLLAKVRAQRATAPVSAPPPSVRPAPPVSAGQGASERIDRRTGQSAARQARPAATQWVEPGARNAAPAKASRRYRTVKGDSLRSLAQRFYGSPGRWKSIYDANLATLQGQGASTALRPGWILVIP